MTSSLATVMTGDGASSSRQVRPGQVTWNAVGRSMEKPVNDSFWDGEKAVWRKNEDRYRVSEHPGGLIASVADGAGSSGMYCGAWAEALVGRLPETPISDIDGLNGWMDGFWQDFSDRHKKLAQSDAVKLNKFIREGSCATLTACWIERRPDGGTRLHWLGYGDSPIYAFAEGEGGPTLIGAFPDSLGGLESDPYMLNWKDLPKDAHLKAGQLDLDGPTTVVLASDGMGQFVLMRYLVELHFRQQATGGGGMPGSSVRLLGEFRQILNSANGKLAGLARAHVEEPHEGFQAELGQLKAALRTETGFLETIRDHHERGLQPNDDSTLIMIDVVPGERDAAG